MLYNTSTFYYPFLFGPRFICHQFVHLYRRGRSSMQGISHQTVSSHTNIHLLDFLSWLELLGLDKLKRYSSYVSK